MTSGRFWRCAAAAAVALLAAGCSSVSPCAANCPAIEGTYTLDFASTDAGLGTDCEALQVALPQGPLAITRQGSDLNATLDGIALSGAIYTTSNFTLSGGGSVGDGGTEGQIASFSLTGTFTPPRGGTVTVGDGGTGDGGTPPVADGGTAQLSGSFFGSWSTQGEGGRRCNVTRPFTGTRQ